MAEPTKRMIEQAKADCDAYKASGNAPRRYKSDNAAHYALASLRLLATYSVCKDATKVGKRKHIESGGDYIAGDWYHILPTMSASTRPDQGFEKRLLAALAVYGKSIGWGWSVIDGHFAIVRTA
jgi:hypothetical protein